MYGRLAPYKRDAGITPSVSKRDMVCRKGDLPFFHFAKVYTKTKKSGKDF